MADHDQAEMLFRSTGALLLALAAAVPVSEPAAQRATLHALPELGSCERVGAPRQAVVDPAVKLVVVLPTGRAEVLATERRLVRWAAEFDGAQRIGPLQVDVVFPAEAADLAALRRRGPRGDHRRWIDREGAVARWFEAITGDPHGARFALADARGRVLRTGRFDAGLRHELADALAGRLDAPVAVRLADREGLARLGANAPQAPDPAGYLHWLDVVRRIDHLAWPQGERELERIVDDAAVRFADRPVWLARIAEAVLQHSPAHAADPRIRRELVAGLRVDKLDPTLRRASFRIHAGVSDDRRARGHGVAWLEAVKSVPGGCTEILDVLEGLEHGTRRFQDLAERVFEVGLAHRPVDAWLARKAFEHHCFVSGDAGAARDFGSRYVAALHGDSQALNSFAWKLLTEDGYAEGHPALALEAARAMATDEHWRTYWRLDTLALACFENGHFAEAVALQQEAVEAADGSAAGRYVERLERYREALAASRR